MRNGTTSYILPLKAVFENLFLDSRTLDLDLDLDLAKKLAKFSAIFEENFEN